jgi:hypothetical protein
VLEVGPAFGGRVARLSPSRLNSAAQVRANQVRCGEWYALEDLVEIDVTVRLIRDVPALFQDVPAVSEPVIAPEDVKVGQRIRAKVVPRDLDLDSRTYTGGVVEVRNHSILLRREPDQMSVWLSPARAENEGNDVTIWLLSDVPSEAQPKDGPASEDDLELAWALLEQRVDGKEARPPKMYSRAVGWYGKELFYGQIRAEDGEVIAECEHLHKNRHWTVVCAQQAIHRIVKGEPLPDGWAMGDRADDAPVTLDINRARAVVRYALPHIHDLDGRCAKKIARIKCPTWDKQQEKTT